MKFDVRFTLWRWKMRITLRKGKLLLCYRRRVKTLKARRAIAKAGQTLTQPRRVSSYNVIPLTRIPEVPQDLGETRIEKTLISRPKG